MEDRCVCCGSVIPEGAQYCPHCKEKISMKDVSIAKNRREFLEGILGYCEYWAQNDRVEEKDKLYGLAFSILVMLDGDSSANNFKRYEIKGITNDEELHDEFCRVKADNEAKEI